MKPGDCDWNSVCVFFIVPVCFGTAAFTLHSLAILPDGDCKTSMGRASRRTAAEGENGPNTDERDQKCM